MIADDSVKLKLEPSSLTTNKDDLPNFPRIILHFIFKYCFICYQFIAELFGSKRIIIFSNVYSIAFDWILALLLVYAHKALGTIYFFERIDIDNSPVPDVDHHLFLKSLRKLYQLVLLVHSAEFHFGFSGRFLTNF